MSQEEKWETTDVVICGCGPTGALLSALLAQCSLPNIVLEREPDITTDPRGIALDEDGVRLLQAVGLYDKIYTEIGSSMGVFNFVGGTRKDLSVKPFMRMVYDTTEGGTGHVGFICHKQPVLEKCLRSTIAQYSCAEIRVRSTIVSLSEDADWVYVRYVDGTGQEHRLRCKFFVGADGKTGFTRKKYLEPRGIVLEKASKMAYEEVWVALNWKLTLPTEKSHPQFPLWALGYTPEQVYDLFFPKEFRFLCNPERPAVCGRFGLPNDRLWRFEFVVQKGEDGQLMASPEKIKEIVFPYITHPGHRYGLAHDVQFPEDCIEVLRSRPFKFSARSCNKWALGRVVLCGDSAHVFPPFGGQGIASGFRDAAALAWRLTVACRPTFTNYEALLAGWYTERKQQLERSLAATVENGEYVTEENTLKIFVRDWMLWFMQLIPSWRHWLEMGPRREGMIRYQYTPGMAFLPEFDGGVNFPQVYCVALDKERPGRVRFTDDVIFAQGKRCLFQLVVLLENTKELETATDALRDLDQAAKGELRADEATIIVHDLQAKLPASNTANKTHRNIFRIAAGEEFAQDKELCGRRPEPRYYDPYRMMREVRGKRYVILRPDRFVFAACRDRDELHEAARKIQDVLNSRPRERL